MTTVIVSHHVADFAAWRTVFEEHGTERAKHGCTSAEVLRGVADGNDVTIIMGYPSPAQADAFLTDPSLKEAMGQAGVDGAPDIRVLEAADQGASLS